MLEILFFATGLVAAFLDARLPTTVLTVLYVKRRNDVIKLGRTVTPRARA